MKKILLPLALCSTCVAILLLSDLPPRSQAQTSIYDIYTGGIVATGINVTNGPPNSTVQFNITQTTIGVMGFALEQPGPDGPWADSLTVPVALDAAGNGSRGYYASGKRAGTTYQNTCSPQVGCTSDSPVRWTVTDPASEAKIQYLKDGVFVDLPATLNVLKNDVVTFRAVPLPQGSRFYEFDPKWGARPGRPGRA